jgi:HK97 family phage major capsid protein
MTKTTETGSRAGEDLPLPKGPEAEVEAALTGLLSELKGFQSEIKSKLKQQEERLTMLDRKSLISGRPALAGAAAVEAPHQKAFAAYVRSGDDDGLRGLSLEGKALNTAVNGEGGYLVDPQTSARIGTVMQSTASIRQIAKIVNVEATSYDVIVDHGDVGSAWATEAGSVAESATPQIERISIPLHELAAMPKASQRLLDDSAFDVEGWLAERIADRFVRAEAAAFVSGNGTDKPKGFLSHTKVANASWAWGSLGYVATGTDGSFGPTPDGIVNLVYALGAIYRANGNFVMNSKTAGEVRKLKDGDGRFLWSDGLAAGEPARLMGYPVLIAEDMPDIATDAHAIAFGDFNAGYTVAERPEVRILRDPFSAKPNVLFYATKRVGGDVSDFAAIKLLKFSAT